MKISVHLEDWELVQPFRISGMEWITSPTLVVQIEEDGCVGRGEAQGVFYLDETAAGLFDQVDSVANEIRKGISRSTAPCGILNASKPAGRSGN
jgi:L-alanine-DL-glutamate epimerase-like enolase superfamily enzyme